MQAHEASDSVILDLLDNQVIRALQIDPRAPFSLIAEVLGVSEQTIARRYRRLRTGGLLRVTGAVDPRALGHHDWLLRLRCRPDATGSLGEALAQREDVSWVSVSAGGSEIVCALRARTRQEGEDLLRQRLPNTAAVLEVTASVLLHRFIGSDARDWHGLANTLTDAQTAKLCSPPAAPVQTGPVRLDAADHALLDVLSRDGRTSFAVLARAAGISEARVVRRISTLRAAGVLYFDLDLAEATVGHPTSAYLWLSVTPRYLDEVGKALAEHDEVHFAAAITGSSNLVASATCANLDELYRYVTNTLGGLDGITSLEISPVLRRLKQAGALTDGHRLAAPSPLRVRPAQIVVR
ncbi:Lrp/AsnC family transcriptional regulator [Jatrophihabitans sp.]|uniref:Lrp/AsnC family transcriptional regulator n=1 Tax=Jatrophihabitans sp. TaxID=1932789 RepID=UPI0030C67127|nr:AsnC family transcriptional regulator [Jatrophihabitans sp.]